MIKYIRRQYRIWHCKRRLAAYVKTLSPAGRSRANALREALDKAGTKNSATILMQAAALISQQQHRVVERIDRQLTGRSM